MSQTTLDAVERACNELLSAGEAVTFTNVADRAGISRPTLYKNPNLRAVVEEHRARNVEARTLSGISGEVAHLRTALEAISERVRHQEERLRHLEARRAVGQPARKAN
ncbi:MAG: DUF6262 family protein [Acidimicrobiales bacterium]